MKTKLEIRKELYLNREQQDICIYCGKESVSELTTKGCKNCLTKKVKSQTQFSQKNKDRLQIYRKKIRKEVINKYGGKCNCCGIDELLFLTLDHKNNDGNLERFSNGNSTMKFFFKLKRELIRNDIQVLCFNCNLGKSMNNGICPHHQPSPDSYESNTDLRRVKSKDVGCKIIWPDNETLINMINKDGLMNVAKNLNIHNTSIRGRLKRRGLYNLINKKHMRIA